MIKKPEFTGVNEDFEVIFNAAEAENMNRAKVSKRFNIFINVIIIMSAQYPIKSYRACWLGKIQLLLSPVIHSTDLSNSSKSNFLTLALIKWLPIRSANRPIEESVTKAT